MISLASPVQAAQDGRLAAWAATFAGGDAAAVLTGVEADLASDTPHPQAADVWLRLQRALGRDPAATIGGLPVQARGRLGDELRLNLADDPGTLASVLTASPPAAAVAPGNAPLPGALAEAAQSLGRWDLALDYRLAAVSAYPDQWDTVAALLDHLAVHPSPEHLRRIAAMAANDGPLAGRPAGRVLARAVEAGAALLPGDRLELVRRWLEHHPDDAAAWRDAGRQAMELDRFEEAADAFARADTLYLFAADGAGQGAALIRLGRLGQARAVIESASGRLAPAGDARRRLVLRSVARALVQAGELGRAEATLDSALGQWPLDPGLLLDLARVELALNQPLRAIAPLQQALSEDGTPGREAAASLVEAWIAAGEPVRAFQQYQDLRRRGHKPDSRLASAAMRAAEAFGDHQSADTLGDDFLDAAPQAAGVLAARAEAVAGLGATRRAAGLMRRSLLAEAPDQARLGRYLDWAGDTDLADLRRELPWSAATWQAGQSRLAAGDAVGRAALAEAAVAAAPHLAWPYLELARYSADSVAAHGAIDRGLAAVPEEFAGQRARLLAGRAALSTGEAALADLEEAGRLGLPRGDVHRLRTALLAAAGRWAEAGQAALDWSMARPDDGEALAWLFRPEVLGHLGWPLAFSRLHDWVERNPYDLDRRLEALRRQSGPGGNPVQALADARALDRNDPGDARMAEGRRLRANVMADLSRLGRPLDIDTAHARLELERPDGTRIEVEFHPVSGRLVRYAEGPAWIRASWDDGGTRLLSLTDASGQTIALDWIDGRLAGLREDGAVRLHAVLGADGRPERIESDLSSDAATAAYDRAAAVLAAWSKGELGTVPELPFSDPALDRLEAREAAGGDHARLATAAYLIEHLGSRRAFAGQARARLDAILGHAMAGRLRRGSSGAKAAELWRRLALAAWPDGLSPEAWNRWTAIRAWAGDPSLDRDGPTPSAAARNKKSSWLGNPANWHPLPASCALEADSAPAMAITLRADGELVVGTSAGLGVLRQGRWQCYAFDRREGRFVGDEAGAPADGAPAVSSLAEAADGVLWLAVGSQLVRMAGPYDGMVDSWPLPPGRLTGLVPLGVGVLAATPAGLRLYGRGGPQQLPAGLADLAAVPVASLSAAFPSGQAATVLAATPDGLVVWRGGGLQILVEDPVDAALWLPEKGVLTILAKGGVLAAAWDGAGRPTAGAVLPNGELKEIGRPTGLAAVVGDDGGPQTAVLGETGFAVLRGGHADACRLPGPVTAVAARRAAVWAAGPAGVWAAEEGIEIR